MAIFERFLVITGQQPVRAIDNSDGGFEDGRENLIAHDLLGTAERNDASILGRTNICLLYTSDAADEVRRV